MDALTTITDRREYERAATLLRKLTIEHTLISPDPAYGHVGCPAIAFSDEAKAQYLERAGLCEAGAIAFPSLGDLRTAHPRP
jgi:hypothetical protein